MQKLIIALAFGTAATMMSLSSSLAANVSCEVTLNDLRAAEATAKVADANKAKMTELETKGIERCNADDDKRANEFFAQAMNLLGK